MADHSTILIIENNYIERANILNEFRKHRLNNKIYFVNNINDALVEIYFFNKEKIYEGYPQIILLNFSKEGLLFLQKIRSDYRFNSVKIYFMLYDKVKSNDIDKNILSKFKIAGYLSKPLKFKNLNNTSYLDSFSLYLELLKLQTHKV